MASEKENEAGLAPMARVHTGLWDCCFDCRTVIMRREHGGDCPHCASISQSCVLPRETVEKVEKALADLLFELSNAERAVSGWKFKGGMGANIAQEDRGRFPTIAYNKHRQEAEDTLSALRRALEGK